MLGFGMPAPQEMIIISFILVLLFGARKLPELARGVGQSFNELKKGLREVDEIKDEVDVSKETK